VLQFVLIWAGAMLIPSWAHRSRGWHNLKAQIAVRMAPNIPTCGPPRAAQRQSHGRAWTASSSPGWVISFGYWTTDFLVVQRCSPPTVCGLRGWRRSSFGVQDVCAFFVILPACWRWCC